MRCFAWMPVLALMSLAPPTFALDADIELEDPVQRALYEKLIDEVRCLVCQNQTIGDSSAPLALDLRREIREQIEQGRTESEIKTFLTERYGDFVLYRPRYGGPGMLLWLAPGLLLFAGIVVLARIVRRRSTLPVTSDEQDTPDSVSPGPARD
jgi:cytochrome c-type biogenesis protein CcmH